MGKRKERRMAAVMAAGRRVKLDLFAEPSGDLGGSSAKDEVGKEVVAKSDTELPNSPSSSGQQAENPLSLLGQYSDDELDERSKDSASAPDGSLTDDDKQAKVLDGKQFEEEEVGGSKNTPPEKADNQELETDSASPSAPIVEDGSASNAVATDEKPNLVTIQNGPVPSDTETAGVVTSGWKMVLHEESKRYYYWNTVTGETSWEVPDALGQGTGHAIELEVLETEMKESAAGDVNASITSIGVKVDDFLIRNSSEYTNCVSDVTGVYEHGPKVYQYVEQCVVDGSHVLPSTSVVGAAMYETSTLWNYSVSEQLAGGQSSSAGSHAIIGEQVTIDPSNVIRHAESLLERLKLLKRSDPDQQSLVSKYILETEIRLSDLRSLSSHGSSLAPFWLHSERHLNQLEDAINTEIDKHNNNIHGMHLSSAEGTDKLQNGGESKVYADDESAELFQKYGHYKVSDDGHSTHLRSGDEAAKESDGAVLMGKASPKFEFQSVEDVDMDVDMELEEGELVTSPDQVTRTNAPTAEQSPGAGSDFIVPPPPEEEWIPPPPPDSEGIPPPPPDEPPESCPPPPPSEPEPVQSIYNDQYNMTYAGSNMNYYVNSTDASGSSFYEHATGSQVASFDPAVYYASASTVLPTAVPTADSAVYYGLQNGMMPIVPVDSSTLGSSGFQTASGNLNYGQLSSKPVEAPNNALSEAFSHLIQQVDPIGPTCSGISSTSFASTPATVSVKEYVSVPSYSAAATSITATTTSTATSDVPVAVSKPPSKTSRMKKPKVAVASSLRCNKKVSSLVDKWKAAKEELQEEEEEERETALEILEKKRQREIEEWRAQQIASGEAKENANFQPLGGDWRERVKRRRAKKESAVETSSDATNDGSKQPDLNELSRDLPPGWQVYWDDSSKQVYYANAVTSETTWIRPTR